MAESYGTIASAVVVPGPPRIPEPPSSSSPQQAQNVASKRKQSHDSAEDDNGKRPRLSIDSDTSQKWEPTRRLSQSHSAPLQQTPGTPSSGITNTAKSPRGRQAAPDEERQRNKRLFGGLLSTLSQTNRSARRTTGKSVEGRRADIDRKQQQKLAKQAEEADEEERRQLDDLRERRMKEQRVWDEENMRLRHASERAMAKFLKTRTEPLLYYQPLNLKSEEKDRIRAQIDETEDRIDRELDESQERRRQKGETEKEVATIETPSDRVIDRPERRESEDHERAVTTHVNGEVIESKPTPKQEDVSENLTDSKDTENDEADKSKEFRRGGSDQGSRQTQLDNQNAEPGMITKEKEEDGDEMEVEAGEDAVIY